MSSLLFSRTTDDNQEITGVDANIASLVGPFRNIMSFFTHIRSAESDTYQLQESMVFLGTLHLRFSRWGAAVKLSGEVNKLKDLHAAVQSQESVLIAKAKLASMANELESVSKITRGRDHAITTDNYQMTSRVLIQRIRGLADSRQCKSKTLRHVRWHLMLQKVCHGSFRRQCKPSATRVNWIFRDEDESTLTGLIRKLSTLISELEKLIPGDGSIATSCCEEEKLMLLPLAQPDSVQLSQLKLSVAKFDARLERAMGWGRYGTSPRPLQVNKNGFF